MIWAMVAPSGRRSMSISIASLVPSRCLRTLAGCSERASGAPGGTGGRRRGFVGGRGGRVLLRSRLARGRRGGTRGLNAVAFVFDGRDPSGRLGGIVPQAGAELFGAHPPVEQAGGGGEQVVEAEAEAFGVRADAAQRRVLAVGIARLAVERAEDGVELGLAEVGHREVGHEVASFRIGRRDDRGAATTPSPAGGCRCGADRRSVSIGSLRPAHQGARALEHQV